MKKLKIAICWTVFMLSGFAIGQNLIVNPSFEEFTTCPGINDGVYYLDGWHELTSEGSLNVLTTCAGTSPSTYSGFQSPRTGEAYLHVASIYLSYPRNFVYDDGSDVFFWKESALGTLTQPLQAGTYYFSTYISLVNQRPASLFNSYMTSAIDLAVFDSIPTGSPYHAQPPYMNESQVVWMNPDTNIISDSIKWVRIGGCFEAKGGEKYFAIGTFRDTSQIVLQPNLIYNLTGYASYTSYFYDDVQIVKCPDCACVETLPDPPDPEDPKESELIVSNNPGLNGTTVTFQKQLDGEKSWKFRLYDSAGRVVRYSQHFSGQINQQVEGFLAAGIYHYVIEIEDSEPLIGKILVGE